MCLLQTTLTKHRGAIAQNHDPLHLSPARYPLVNGRSDLRISRSFIIHIANIFSLAPKSHIMSAKGNTNKL